MISWPRAKVRGAFSLGSGSMRRFMKAKKSLGQNFLKSEKALADIVDASDVHADDIVLEIGPGKGALTAKLLETGAKVIAIEKDRELIPLLQETFADYIASGKLELLEADILSFDPSHYPLVTSYYRIVANIPYYITGAIIRKFLESDRQPISMTLLVQKEVAERIVARDGKESILSISVKAYGTPKFIGKVPKRYFTPEPSVDSAIIHIDNISKDRFKKVSEIDFFKVVKVGFGQKRKTLAKNLKDLGIVLPPHLPEKVRAEDISLDDWFSIGETL